MTHLLEWATVIAFLAFVGLIIWVYGRNRKPMFEEAGQLPFALPDEIETNHTRSSK